MNKSILVVGNGSTLKDCNLGKKIDEFDCIFRFNSYKIEGFEKDCGNKNNIWVMYNPIKIEKTTEDKTNIEEIWYVSWNLQNLTEDWKNNNILDSFNVKDKVKRHQSVQNSRFLQIEHQKPSTGLMLIKILLNMYDKIYIIGFDFKIGEFQHYYGTKKMEDALRTHAHDKDAELQILSDFIKEGKIIQLNKDTIIEKSTPLNIQTQKFICNNCKMENKIYFWESRICQYCESLL